MTSSRLQEPGFFGPSGGWQKLPALEGGGVACPSSVTQCLSAAFSSSLKITSPEPPHRVATGDCLSEMKCCWSTRGQGVVVGGEREAPPRQRKAGTQWAARCGDLRPSLRTFAHADPTAGRPPPSPSPMKGSFKTLSCKLKCYVLRETLLSHPWRHPYLCLSWVLSLGPYQTQPSLCVHYSGGG